jgi:hypothetical protein
MLTFFDPNKTAQRPRQVGVVLKHLPSDPSARFNHDNVPWQRVINAKGVISPRYGSFFSFFFFFFLFFSFFSFFLHYLFLNSLSVSTLLSSAFTLYFVFAYRLAWCLLACLLESLTHVWQQ